MTVFLYMNKSTYHSSRVYLIYSFLFLLIVLLIIEQLQSQYITEIYKRYPNKLVLSNYVKRHLDGLLTNEESSSTSNNLNTDNKHVDFTEIYGDSDKLNYYFIKVYIGKHKQESSLILDTGSSVMCLTCQNTCESCGVHSFPHYNPENSPNFSFLDCLSKDCSAFPSYSTCETNKCKFKIVSFII
jgi:hypothetical protein